MNIVITGAGRGIGLELVKILAIEEANTIYAFSRNLKKIKDLKLENVKCFSIDFCADNYKPEITSVLATMPAIDIIINNAGYLVNKPFKEIESEDLLNSYQVNVFAPFYLIQQSLSKLGKNSHIVNISSMGGFQGSSKFPGLTAYSSSKAALGNLTEVLAEELKEEGVAVNCLALGAVQTEMLEEAFPGYEAPTTPDEMAEFIADFALNGNRFFNGKILPVSISTP